MYRYDKFSFFVLILIKVGKCFCDSTLLQFAILLIFIFIYILQDDDDDGSVDMVETKD